MRLRSEFRCSFAPRAGVAALALASLAARAHAQATSEPVSQPQQPPPPAASAPVQHAPPAAIEPWIARWYAPPFPYAGVGAPLPGPEAQRRFLELERARDPGASAWRGGRPVIGERTYFWLGASERFFLEGRDTPAPNGSTGSGLDFFGKGDQEFYRNQLALSADLYGAPNANGLAPWRVRATAIWDASRFEANELGVVDVDPAEGKERDDDDLALHEAFAEWNFEHSGGADWVGLQAGMLPLRTDFRGFVFHDNNLGAHAAGTSGAGAWEYHLAAFDMRDKDTNSRLTKLDEERDQDVLYAGLYRRDWFPFLGEMPGYTTQVSLHYNHDDAQREFDDNGFLVIPAPVGSLEQGSVETLYLGWAGEGRIGELELSHALYQVYGRDSGNPIAAQSVEVDAQMAAFEAALDFGLLRWAGYGMYASGDPNATDGEAEGFDAILDAPQFAGGELSLWHGQSVALLGLELTGAFSPLPDLASSKTQGHANHVNPGLQLVGTSLSAAWSERLVGQVGVNYLRFDETDTLEELLGLAQVEPEIGLELYSGLRYRPTQAPDTLLHAGFAVLVPGDGLRRIYDSDDTLWVASLGFELAW